MPTAGMPPALPPRSTPLIWHLSWGIHAKHVLFCYVCLHDTGNRAIPACACSQAGEGEGLDGEERRRQGAPARGCISKALAGPGGARHQGTLRSCWKCGRMAAMKGVVSNHAQLIQVKALTTWPVCHRQLCGPYHTSLWSVSCGITIVLGRQYEMCLFQPRGLV